MIRRLLLPVAILAAAAGLTIDAATSTRPADAPPEPMLLFGPPPGRAEQQLQTVLKEVNFERVPLETALTQIAKEADINLIVMWHALETAGFEAQQPVSLNLREVTVAEALSAICQTVQSPTAPLGFSARGNIVTFSTADDLGSQTVVYIYDIADLILLEHQRREALRAPGDDSVYAYATEEIIEDIAKLIGDTVVPDSWRDVGGSTGVLREIGGRLIVTQTPEAHRQIAKILDGLRQTGLPRQWTTQPATRPL